jgi:hypothetical protein
MKGSDEFGAFCLEISGGGVLATHWNGSGCRAFSVRMEVPMGLAEYMIVAKGNGWSVLHDGVAANEYATKEAAFESAVAAASLAIREGHEVHVSVPGQDSGNRTALGARE